MRRREVRGVNVRNGFAAPMVWLFVLLVPQAVGAATLEEMLMPGPVIQGHAKFESACNKCHERFSKTSQSRLCLACHKEAASDISSHMGFHGRIKNIATAECKQCHTEHKGRTANIVPFDKETFDHGATDFPLAGAHTRVACASCHRPNTKYRQAPAACVACHKADDRHRGRLGETCAKCHTDQDWRSARFDHDKRTKYPLTGRHREVICSACHLSERYRDTPKDCYACHRLNDVHTGRFGKKCESCHATTGWRRIAFDHDRRTKFPLRGAHRKTSCHSCHSEKIFGDKLKTDCIACHRNDDEHQGRNGPKCERCHSVVSWGKSRFNHNKDTKFPLRDSHARLTCEACHRGGVGKKKLGTTCNACHRRDDVHAGRLGEQCDRCHNAAAWAKKVFFDHDLTRFPLIGLHAVLPCEECHLAATYKGTTLDCAKCHEKSDVHKRRLGPKCGSCHNPNGWAFWRFDHNKQTDFVLDGAHEGLHCDTCHRSPAPRQISMSRSCTACHSGDDVHRGRFGQRCDRCHVTKSFKTIRLNR